MSAASPRSDAGVGERAYAKPVERRRCSLRHWLALALVGACVTTAVIGSAFSPRVPAMDVPGVLGAHATHNHSDASQIHSDASQIHSDASQMHSDASQMHSDASQIHSDASQIHSDASQIHSDASQIHSDASQIHSDASQIHSDASQIHSDASQIHSSESRAAERSSPSPSSALQQGGQPRPPQKIDPTFSTIHKFRTDIRHFYKPRAPEATREVIRGNCQLIRDPVLGKWLPLARKEADGVHRVHIGMVGDSNGERISWGIIGDLEVCMEGSWPRMPTNILPEVPYSSHSIYTVFRPDINHTEHPQLARGVEMVFSHHKVPHCKNTAQTLAMAYSPLFRGTSNPEYEALRRPAFSTDLYPIVRDSNSSHFGKSVPGTWLSPTMRLRAPEVLYITCGSWDMMHGEPKWDGYELFTKDYYREPGFVNTTFPRLLRDFDATLRANFSEPMLALFKVWENAWREERFRVGDLSALESAYSPPRHVVVATPPKSDCRGKKFHPLQRNKPPSFASLKHTRFLRSFQRCSALVVPLERMMLDAVRHSVPERTDGTDNEALVMPHSTMLDWTLDENPCRRSDGVHMDYLSPLCRRYIIQRVYTIF